jgi:hypothetical protein
VCFTGKQNESAAREPRKFFTWFLKRTVKHILNLLTWIVNFGVKKNLCDGLSFHVQKPTVNNIKTEDLAAKQLKKLLEAIEKAENIQAAGMMKMAHEQ